MSSGEYCNVCEAYPCLGNHPLSNPNELVIYPKTQPEPPKRQWYVIECGEYECVHYEVTAELPTEYRHRYYIPRPVDLTDDEAKSLKEISELYREQQQHLESLYSGSRS